MNDSRLLRSLRQDRALFKVHGHDNAVNVRQSYTPPIAPSITVHILHDNTLSTDNRDKFIYLAGQYGQLVKFYNVEVLCAGKLDEIKRLIPKLIKSSFSVATMYRLLIPQILPTKIDKVIYLDSDIAVNLDIAELWQIELGDKVLGVITEFSNGSNTSKFQLVKDGLIKFDEYFNAGVLLMNLNALRTDKDHIMSGIKFYGEHPQLKYFDQDVLNYLYSKNCLKLPGKFNCFAPKARNLYEKVTKKIYHFVWITLQFDMRDPFNRLWMSYFMRTPWFDVDTMGRLYADVQQMHVGLKQSMANVSAMMSGKTRAFFTAPQSVDAVKKIFSVRADEEIIPAENQLSLKKLIDSMNASRGKKLFFIVLQGFPFSLLNQLGFVAGRDFVNGMDFLSEAQGFPLNSHNLIKAM